MTKKILAMLLAVLMLVSLITACESGSGTSSTETPTSSTTTTESTTSTTESTGGETSTGVDLSVKRDLSIGIGTNTFITDYYDNGQTILVEEAMNCEIEFLMLPAGGDGLTKLQLMINGGDELPDVFAYNLSNALTYQYGSGGTFVALNQWYEDPAYAPYFHAIESEEDKATMLSNATSADGNMYAMIQWQPETWNLTPYRIYMNMVWLENLGLEVPTTTDELKDVLVAFANDDPNGNGIKDEIPVWVNYVDGGSYGCNAINAFTNMFVYGGTSMSSLTLSEDGKTVIAPQLTDAYREALIYLNELYNEGAIIDGSFVYNDGTAYKGTLNYQGIGTEAAPEGKSINIVGMFTAGSNSGNFANSGIDQNVNYLEYQMIPVPTGPDGQAYSAYSAHYGSKYWYVTEEAEEPDFCVTVGDYFYDFEMSMMTRYGTEEVDWTIDETVCSDWYTEHTALIEAQGYEQPIDDYYSIVRLRADAVWGENTNAFWHNVQPRYASLEFFNHAVDWFDPETFVYYNGNYGRLSSISKAYYADLHPTYVLPVIEYTNEEQEEITDIQIQWPEKLLEWDMFFITGEKDPTNDADWQAWLDVANNELGVATYIENTQSAYERTTQYQSLG